jgi:hypothetical protein
LQDALKQERELGSGAPRVLFAEFQHGILHNIQGQVFVANREECLLEGTTLNLSKKIR